MLELASRLLVVLPALAAAKPRVLKPGDVYHPSFEHTSGRLAGAARVLRSARAPLDGKIDATYHSCSSADAAAANATVHLDSLGCFWMELRSAGHRLHVLVSDDDGTGRRRSTRGS